MEELTSTFVLPEDRRKHIREKVMEGIKESFPLKSRNKLIEIDHLHFQEHDFTSSEQKHAILAGDTLFEPVKGTVRLKDADGKVVDEVKNFTLARIPWFTPRHTFIVAGNEYSISNMIRQKPGIYTRKKSNGELQTVFNVIGSKNFNIIMDPAKGQPQLEYGSTKIPLYPILRKAGISHEHIAESWGKKLADENEKALHKKTDQYVEKLYTKVIPVHRQTAKTPDEKMKEIIGLYEFSKMRPDVNEQTLGKPYAHVTPDSLLNASGKMLRVFRQVDDVDDRDNLDFKSFHSVEDLFKERIKLDSRDIARKASIKMEATPELRKVLPSGPFTKGLLNFMSSSQLSAIPSQTNPMELIDASIRVTSLGEGGITTDRAIPPEARKTHITQMGVLDPIRTPETFRAGIDIRTALLTRRDKEGNLYAPLYDVKKKKIVFVRPGQIKKSVIAFPSQELKGHVDAVSDGTVKRVPASKVEYQFPHPSTLYSPTTNLIPFIESNQGNRSIMGAKMQTQALSLVDREEPLVQVQSGNKKFSFEALMGQLINPTSPVDGTVVKVDKDNIWIRPTHKKQAEEKEAKEEDLIPIGYDTHLPMASKTFLHHTLNVKEGDKVQKDQILAESNFTRNGKLALGRNMLVAYVPYHGANSNDATVISEGAAKKLTSQRLYKVSIPRDPDLQFNKDKHQTYYGNGYTKDQYKPLDKDGVITPGTRILPGDPVVLGLRKTQPSADDLILGKLHRSLVKPYREYQHLWDHDHPGEVIDVVKTPKRITLTVKTLEPVSIGDKLSGLFGNKGIVAQIIPDDQIFHDAQGRPIDILLTPTGIASRINPSQVLSTALGKVAEKTGKPILVENLTGRDNVKWVKSLLKQHGVTDKETITDPMTGKKIPNVFVGRQYMFKLMKSTDTNYAARNIAEYDVNQQPTRGGEEGAKGIGKMEFDALIAHNARNFLKETSTLKSQKNDEFWRNMQLGYPTPLPKPSFAYDKFLNMLHGAGVRVVRKGQYLSIAPLTDGDIKDLSSGEILEPKIVKAKDLSPEPGGLFDPAITGGLSGNKWSHIDLAEPIVNPMFREPARRLLGMTNSEFETAIREKGGAHIKKELAGIDLNKKEDELLESMKGKHADRLDSEVKQIKYIRALKRQGLTPDNAYVISKIPIVPPVIRPVLPGKGGQEIMYGDINPLYRDLIYVNNQFKDTKKHKELENEAEKLRPILHQAVGAVFGTDDPITAKSKMRQHKGFLAYIAGTGSPKYGFFQSRLMRRGQDVSGRGTIAPDSTLGMDEVGLPEDMLWTMYEKFIIQKLVRNGHSALEAQQLVTDRKPAAKEMLMREILERPVVINRAPTLHRYNVIGAFPRPVPGKTIRVNPFLEAGSNSDYDGDAMQVHVPVSLKAINDVKSMTLSNILFSDKSKNDLLVFPQHEALLGISIGSSATSTDTKTHKFKTKAEAIQAYHEGKITLGSKVEIEKD